MIEFFKNLSTKYKLDEFAVSQYIKYCNYLNEENQKYNLTGFKTLESIVSGNIVDSLEGIYSKEILKSNEIIDIGTGCGVPGIVLAIKFPEKKFYLMEVIEKRIYFLEEVIKILDLKNCEIISYDFKTLIRKGYIKTSCFITRASLPLKDLFFMFSESSKYEKASLVYWGSKSWNELFSKKELQNFKITKHLYEINSKEREIVDFKNFKN